MLHLVINFIVIYLILHLTANFNVKYKKEVTSLLILSILYITDVIYFKIMPKIDNLDIIVDNDTKIEEARHNNITLNCINSQEDNCCTDKYSGFLDSCLDDNCINKYENYINDCIQKQCKTSKNIKCCDNNYSGYLEGCQDNYCKNKYDNNIESCKNN